MFFYREVPPSNQPPNISNLKVWFDGKNIDGSNNSTLSDGGFLPSTISNLGTAGGSWTNSSTPGKYQATPPAAKFSTSNDVIGGTPVNDVSAAMSSGYICGACVFTLTDTSYGSMWRNNSDASSIGTVSNETNPVFIFLNNNKLSATGFIPQVGVRYCLSWKNTPTELKLRINGTEWTGAQSTGASFTWQSSVGADGGGGGTINGTIETLAVWDDQTVDLSAVETWATNYYGTLG
jgi:hypothetical protein